MSKKREPIELPDGLERQIVALVGRHGRNAFVREAVRQEIERRRVLATLAKSEADRTHRNSR